MDQLFDKYLAAAVSGENEQADQYLRGLRNIGRLIGEIKGDLFVADAVNFVSRGSIAVKKEVQVIRQLYYSERKKSQRAATQAPPVNLYSKASGIAERIGDHSHAELAALGLARYYLHRDGAKGIDYAQIQTRQRQ